MAYDGLWISSQINYYQKNLINDRIYKITQNNIKEYDFHIHKNKKDYILTLCCNPTFPYMLYSCQNKDNFDTPKAFLMLLRKYLQGGEILDIEQINGKNNNSTLERIVDFTIKNLSDMGDVNIYHIIIELMGKYSNIILCDNQYKIIDLVNKISDNTTNRTLLPNNKYETITISKKIEYINITFDNFVKNIKDTYHKALLNNDCTDLPSIFCDTFLGFSKTYIYNKFCDKTYDIDDENDLQHIYNTVNKDIKSIYDDSDIHNKYFIYYKNNKIKDFHNIKYDIYDDCDIFDTPDECLLSYINHKLKDTTESYDKTLLKEKINNIIEKYTKKLDINQKDLKKCEDMEKYKLYGDLLSSYGYDASLIKDNIITCNNYYDNDKPINIPIDTTISIQNNIKKYYDKYNKLKRTYTKVNELYIENQLKLEHILSIKDSLDMCNEKTDILNIKDELKEYFNNTIKSKDNNKKLRQRSHILLHHYKSTHNIDIYVGKNNLQNEYLTFTYADKNDTWLHIKNDTGSHVILKSDYNICDIKDIYDAASIAAYFSSKKNEKKVEVDYTLVKELKKVKGKAPGFCIYHKNYSIVVEPRLLNEVR